MKVEKAPDVQFVLERIVRHLDLPHVNEYRLLCMRSFESKARAYARIWSLPKIWQEALGIRAYYVIEVLSENFDGLSDEEKEKTLIHELLHIPRTFSGALLPHEFKGRRIDSRAVNALWKQFKEREKKGASAGAYQSTP